MSDPKIDKLFITELINDLYSNGFILQDKTRAMLHDWAKELRGKNKIKQGGIGMTNQMKALCSIKLHEAVALEEGRQIVVLRVPGGWIYEFFEKNSNNSFVFVPFVMDNVL